MFVREYGVDSMYRKNEKFPFDLPPRRGGWGELLYTPWGVRGWQPRRAPFRKR